MTEACDTVASGKTYCVNCTEAYITKKKETTPKFAKEDITPNFLINL